MSHGSGDTVHHDGKGVDPTYGCEGRGGERGKLPVSYLGGSGNGMWHSAALSFPLVDSV